MRIKHLRAAPGPTSAPWRAHGSEVFVDDLLLVICLTRYTYLLNLLLAAAVLVLLALNVACFVLYWLAYMFYMLRGEPPTAPRALPCLIA